MRCRLDGEAHVPVFTLTTNGDGLNLAVQRAVQFNLNIPHALHKQVTARQQLVTVSVRGERDAVVATARFEARKSRFLSLFQATKERFERLIETLQNVLSAVTVGQTEVTRLTNLRELSGLVVVTDALAMPSIGLDAFLKCRVVETGRFRQLSRQGFRLRLVRIQPVFEGLLEHPRVNDLSGFRCTS